MAKPFAWFFFAALVIGLGYAPTLTYAEEGAMSDRKEEAKADKKLQERIELTCTGNSGSLVAEKVKSYELGREANLHQRLECKAVLADFISSGMDLVSAKKGGKERVYLFVGEGAALATLPTELYDIGCNPQGSTGKWTCKCTGGHVIYCEVFCAPVIENYFTCDEDESTNDRVVRYINLLSRE
jgi:hypothetical protein